MERGDWKNSIYQIYETITKQKIEQFKEDLGILGTNEQEELEKICNKFNVPYLLAAKILHTEFEMQNISDRQKVHTKIEKIIAEEWRTNMDDAVKDAWDKKRMIREVKN